MTVRFADPQSAQACIKVRPTHFSLLPHSNPSSSPPTFTKQTLRKWTVATLPAAASMPSCSMASRGSASLTSTSRMTTKTSSVPMHLATGSNQAHHEKKQHRLSIAISKP